MNLKELSRGIRDLKAWMRKNPRPKPLTKDRVCGGLKVVASENEELTEMTIQKVSLVGKRPNITLVDGTVLIYNKSSQNWVLYDAEGHFKSMYNLYPNRAAVSLAILYNSIDKANTLHLLTIHDLINSYPDEPA